MTLFPRRIRPQNWLTICMTLLAFVAYLAAPAVAQQDPGPDSLRETFRDWSVNCGSAEDGARICEMVQQVNHQESGQRILAFAIQINAQGQPVAVLITPFGLRLSEGLALQVGDRIVAEMTYDTCLAEGCLVIAPLSPEVIAAMQQGADGAVIMVSRQNAPVSVPLSMLGFTSGLNRLRALAAG